ncbi:conserved hypothetical protein, secreted [Candidatus Magnetomorum sp. HK-1]|nr:conserved hypothetical protein, secreted [Candidatus Magnetomorum sp. HK-1]
MYKYFFIALTAFSMITGLSYAADYTITAAEYYIDTDPGEGNAIPLPAKDGAFDSNEEEVDMDDLTIPENVSVGYHHLYVRMRNQEGVWGLPQKHLFKVTGSVTIQAAEYFWGTDPGEGQGISLTVNNGQVDVADIDTSTLAPGIHQIFMRMQNSEDTWGPARQFDIEILEQPIIQSADYYFDYIPESGQGTALQAADKVFDSQEEKFEGFQTVNMPIGTYTVFVRAQDSHGRWSIPESKKITIKYPAHISGRVYTSIAGWENLSIANAHIALEGTQYSTTTDANGSFVLVDMPSGEYTFTVTTPDFQKYSQRINWSKGNPIELNLPPVERGIYSQSYVEKIIQRYDPSMDNRISLEEAIHALKTVSGMVSE